MNAPRLVQLGKLGARPQAPRWLVPLRFRPVAGEVLLTNQAGDHVFVTEAELAELFRGEVAEGSPLHERLRAAHFVHDAAAGERMVERLRARKRFLDYGPNLHIMVVTLRCNETCVYCHASRADMDATETDMTPETAERVVDTILCSTSPSVTIEFQGGEPLVNFPVIRHVVEYAEQKNRAHGKQLEFTMVSNLSLMDEEKLAYLLDKRVQICTSIDGPPALHDRQRKLPLVRSAGAGQAVPTGEAGAYAAAARWMARINEAYAALGLDPVLYHVEALITLTREALAHPRAIVDTYLGLGCRAIFLRPLDPFGFAAKTGHRVGYEVEEYLAFYRAAVDYILELNRKGEQVLERFAALFLTKILSGEDPNYLDIRNPCGAAIGQLAYDFDGRIYTCDEGRMLGRMGDGFFAIGQAGETRYRELMTHETVRAMVVASNLDGQPDCTSCTYNPYCGVCPVHSYATQGSIFGRMRESHLCAVHKGIQDYLFGKLRHADPETRAILERWTTIRPRTHFIQACASPGA
ncbi:MAG: His-Xaa-Ser system radical SAM maturase HxsB [Myxococcales bacterium]|nr:His-Xaa-Ser system radical SAM maturase HxsB [Myxococcales bacterium]